MSTEKKGTMKTVRLENAHLISKIRKNLEDRNKEAARRAGLKLEDMHRKYSDREIIDIALATFCIITERGMVSMHEAQLVTWVITNIAEFIELAEKMEPGPLYELMRQSICQDARYYSGPDPEAEAKLREIH